MGTFQDELWTELLDEHGAALAEARRPTSRRRHTRPVLVAAGGFGVAGLATALALTVTATTAAPAFAVTRNGDGSITVTLTDLLGVNGANTRLAALGAPARVVTIGDDCPTVPVVEVVVEEQSPSAREPADLPPGAVPAEVAIGVRVQAPSGGKPAAITFRPNAAPTGGSLLFAAQQRANSVLFEVVGVELPVAKAPSCIRLGPYQAPASAGPSAAPESTASAAISPPVSATVGH